MQIRLTRDDKLRQVREATLSPPAIYVPEDPEEDDGLPWIRGPRGWIPVTDPVSDQCDDLCPGLWLHALPPYPVRKARDLDPVLLEQAVWGDAGALKTIQQIVAGVRREKVEPVPSSEETDV